MNRIEKSVIELFKNEKEQSIKELLQKCQIPRSTLKKYLAILAKKGILQAIGSGRGRYYKLLTKPKTTQVAVFKSGKLVGILSYDDGVYSFEYEKSYRSKKLDGLEKNLTTSTTLFPIFENLIPESDRRDAYFEKGKNLCMILLELENTHGDFDFVSLDKVYSYKRNYKQRPNWIRVKDKILENQSFLNILDIYVDIEKEVLEEKGRHSSLSGYQNKIDVNVDFKKGVVFQSNNPLYLLKPYNKESVVYDFKNKQQNYLPYLGLNEHLFMSFAKNAYGFDVPWSAVIAGEKDFHYIVKRYDRFDGYKYEQRDFAQIMGIKSDQKYFTTSEKLFDAVKDVIKSKEERIKFLEFYLFSFLIQHADLHIKNISVINIGYQKLQLSPLYDLISNGVYFADSDELGLPLNAKRKNICLQDFYKLSNRLEISKLQTKKSAKKIIQIFIDQFPLYIDKCSKITLFENLKINKSRYGFSNFTIYLQKFYDRRLKVLKERGFLEELGL